MRLSQVLNLPAVSLQFQLPGFLNREFMIILALVFLSALFATAGETGLLDFFFRTVEEGRINPRLVKLLIYHTPEVIGAYIYASGIARNESGRIEVQVVPALSLAAIWLFINWFATILVSIWQNVPVLRHLSNLGWFALISFVFVMMFAGVLFFIFTIEFEEAKHKWKGLQEALESVKQIPEMVKSKYPGLVGTLYRFYGKRL